MKKNIPFIQSFFPLFLFVLCFFPSLLFANDNCSNATSISSVGIKAYSTSGATTDAAGGLCDPFRANTLGIWFHIIGNGGTVNLSTCIEGTNYDTWIGVYTGICSNLTCVTSNDDSPNNCSIKKASDVAFNAQKGVSYYVLVGGHGLARGSVTLGVFCSGGGGDCITPDLCPTDPTKIFPGICGCNKPDADFDNDGVYDCNDLCPTDPNKVDPGICGCNQPDIDRDGDNVVDCEDLCPDDPNKTAPGICGCGQFDLDSDGDGIANCNDNCDNRIDADKDGIVDCNDSCDDRIDSDGDGISDCNDRCDNRIDSDGDGVNDCVDQCPNDPNKHIKDDCGCGTPPQIDSDGDGIINCLDDCPYNLDAYVTAVLRCGEKVTSSNHSGKRNVEQYGECTNENYLGRELFYKFTLYQAGNFTLHFKELRSRSNKELVVTVLNDVCQVNSCIGTLVSGNNQTNSLVFDNALAGDYYVVVDSRGFYDRANFELQIECNNSNGVASCGEDAVATEDFESYLAGSAIDDSEQWALYSENARSAYVTEFEHNKVLTFDRSKNAADVNFLLNNLYKGTYQISWDMFVEKNMEAIFNLFGHISTPSYGVKYKIKSDDHSLQDRWMRVEVIIDLDKDRYQLYIDNRNIVIEGDYLINIIRLNFYTSFRSNFHIDNICAQEIKATSTSSRKAKGATQFLVATENVGLQQTNKANAQQLDLYSSNDYVLKAYPNPTTGLLTIKMPLKEENNLTFTLFDQIGRKVKQFQVKKSDKVAEQIDVSDLPNGVYLLHLLGKSVSQTQKIIIAK